MQDERAVTHDVMRKYKILYLHIKQHMLTIPYRNQIYAQKVPHVSLIAFIKFLNILTQAGSKIKRKF